MFGVSCWVGDGVIDGHMESAILVSATDVAAIAVRLVQAEVVAMAPVSPELQHLHQGPQYATNALLNGSPSYLHQFVASCQLAPTSAAMPRYKLDPTAPSGWSRTARPPQSPQIG